MTNLQIFLVAYLAIGAVVATARTTTMVDAFERAFQRYSVELGSESPTEEERAVLEASLRRLHDFFRRMSVPIFFTIWLVWPMPYLFIAWGKFGLMFPRYRAKPPPPRGEP